MDQENSTPAQKEGILEQISKITSFLESNKALFLNKSEFKGEEIFNSVKMAMEYISEEFPTIMDKNVPPVVFKRFDLCLNSLSSLLGAFCQNAAIPQPSTNQFTNQQAKTQLDQAYKNHAVILSDTVNKIENQIYNIYMFIGFPIKNRDASRLVSSLKKSFNEIETKINEKTTVLESKFENLNKTSQSIKSMQDQSTDGIRAELYLTESKIEKTAANNFRKLGMATLVFLIVVIAFFGFASLKYSTTINDLLMRFSIAIPISILVFYCWNESSKHRTMARRFTEIQLQLKTLPIYLSESQDQKEAEALRVRLADRYFIGASDTEMKLDPFIKTFSKLFSVFEKSGFYFKKN